MKCLVCKIGNATREMKKHPNYQTIFIVRHLLHKIRQRELKDINSICENCRVPLVFNNILTDAGSSLNKIYDVKGTKVSLN